MAEPELPQNRLESWKEIAAYLQRNVITVQRWEKQEGLPVHRHPHQKRSSVYAYASEIDQWRESRKAAPAPSVRRQLLTPSFALTSAVTVALCLVMAGNGARPQLVEAALGERRILVCSGSDCDQAKLPRDVQSLVYNPNKFGRAFPGGDARAVIRSILSPDGSRIAYTARADQRAYLPSEEVSVVNADGSGARTVYRGGLPQAWSPDGSRLLISSGESLNNLVWLDLAGGRTHKLPPHWNVLKPVVSPDGRYIAFSAGKDRDSIENVFVMASDGSSETVVSANPAFQEPIGWMPDGKTLVYQQYSEPMTLWAVPVVNGPAANGIKVQGAPFNLRTEFGKDAYVLGISRTGALYYSVPANTHDIYTALMNPASGRVTSQPIALPVLRAGSNVWPEWAPDSSRLLFQTAGSQREDPEAHIFSFDSGKEEPLSVDVKIHGGVATYCWSRDGASLLFTGPDNPWQLSRFDLSSGRVATLSTAKPGGFQLASCSGDLAVVRGRTGLELRNLINGSSTTVYDAGPDGMAMDALISHDGRSVAFTTGAPPFDRSHGPKAIRIVSTNGGAPRDIVTAVAPQELQYSSLAWSPDDRFLYFTRRADAHSPFELYRIPAAGGQPESMGLKLDGLGRIDIAPDGTRIAFAVGSSGSELWAVEGFLPKR